MFAAEVCVCGSLSSFHQREFNRTLSAVKHWALSCAGKRLTLRLKTSEDVCPLLKWLSSLSITSHASSVSLQKIRFLKLIFFLLLRLPQCSFISFFSSVIFSSSVFLISIYTFSIKSTHTESTTVPLQRLSPCHICCTARFDTTTNLLPPSIEVVLIISSLLSDNSHCW